MICASCRSGALAAANGDPDMAEAHHLDCPEQRRRVLGLTAVELAGSTWCDCQHKVS